MHHTLLKRQLFLSLVFHLLEVFKDINRLVFTTVIASVLQRSSADKYECMDALRSISYGTGYFSMQLNIVLDI